MSAALTAGPSGSVAASGFAAATATRALDSYTPYQALFGNRSEVVVFYCLGTRQHWVRAGRARSRGTLGGIQ